MTRPHAKQKVLTLVVGSSNCRHRIVLQQALHTSTATELVVTLGTQGRVGRDSNVVDLAELSESLLCEVGVQLNLVNRRLDPRIAHDIQND